MLLAHHPFGIEGMSMGHCPLHGRVGKVECCEHVAAVHCSGQQPEGHRFQIVIPFFLCDDCFDDLGFPAIRDLMAMRTEDLVDVDDRLWKVFQDAEARIPGKQMLCPECLDRKPPTVATARSDG